MDDQITNGSSGDDNAPHGMSRAQLYEIFVLGQGASDHSIEAPQKYFDFEKDADDGKTYGIDVSHHKGNIDWARVKDAGAEFSYAKATEGKTFTDPRFVANHRGARNVGLPVGAYHFMSHGTEPADQAANFIGVYKPERQTDDMPPVLDLEWDKKPGTNYDRWTGQTPQRIVDKCIAWLNIVEADFGVKPLIYTNKYWWEKMLGDEGKRLASYKIWMSRYGKFDLPAPPMPEGLKWAIWQFTEHGRIAGIDGRVDVDFLAPDFKIEPSDTTPTPPSCDVPDAPKAQSALTDSELRRVFDLVRVHFGSFSDDQVRFLNVLINTTSPGILRALITGKTETELSETERHGVFRQAQDLFGGTTLNEQQVDLLSVLTNAASAEAVRNCILKS